MSLMSAKSISLDSTFYKEISNISGNCSMYIVHCTIYHLVMLAAYTEFLLHKRGKAVQKAWDSWQNPFKKLHVWNMYQEGERVCEQLSLMQISSGVGVLNRNIAVSARFHSYGTGPPGWRAGTKSSNLAQQCNSVWNSGFWLLCMFTAPVPPPPIFGNY
jgi:hypothetical protein